MENTGIESEENMKSPFQLLEEFEFLGEVDPTEEEDNT